jgi:hypothetical protein
MPASLKHKEEVLNEIGGLLYGCNDQLLNDQH